MSVVFGLGKSNETPALQDINLDIYDGEYVIFFGPSGSGKSTLLYTIAGLETPTSGEVAVGGKHVADLDPSEKIHFYQNSIGMVFQAYFLIPHLTARDNILLPRIFAKTDKAKREQKVNALVEKFGLIEFQDRKPSRMSGGQQQRTAIARALVNDPEIILADEPVGNLDTRNAEIVLDLLYKINTEEKKTVIYVTHNPRDLHYAHRIFYIRDGKLERIVKNPKRTSESGGTRTSGNDLEIMAQLYPYLTEAELKAKLVTQTLISTYDIRTESAIESIVARYVNKEIGDDELRSLLDDPKGGAGLYAQKAAHLARDIKKTVAEIGAVEKLVTEDAPSRAVAQAVRRYVLDEYKGTVTPEMIGVLDAIIEKRVSDTLQKNDVAALLDRSIKAGGLGLNRRTAERFAELIELMLMKDNQR